MEILINNKVALQRAELGAGERERLCQKEKKRVFTDSLAILCKGIIID